MSFRIFFFSAYCTWYIFQRTSFQLSVSEIRDDNLTFSFLSTIFSTAYGIILVAYGGVHILGDKLVIYQVQQQYSK